MALVYGVAYSSNETQSTNVIVVMLIWPEYGLLAILIVSLVMILIFALLFSDFA